MNIIEKAKLLPDVPGIYLFKDTNNTIIYIGKAKSLKTRVSSYFQKTTRDFKVDIMVQEIHNFDYIPTKSETEALLLEAELIQKNRPKFNILLKDGQPFIYLLITDGELPEFKIVRTKKEKGSYFGPFLHKTPARKIFNFLTKTFSVKRCNKKIENGCLQYHMGICAGTCRNNFNTEEYRFRLELIKKILNGKYVEFEQQIAMAITQYNKNLLFEKSQTLIQYLENLEHIISVVKTNFSLHKFEPLIDLIKNTQQQFVPNRTLAQELKEFLGLSITPRIIDCFDISHFQSQSIVGSCVRFIDGVPAKNMFRRFKIKTLDEQNDYAALAEIVQRRYRASYNLPDLIVIDGGKGQLNAIQPLFPNTECISLAKREERAFSKTYPNGKLLDIQTDIGKLLIAIRDYAHHFAISYHRFKRSKNLR